MRFSTSVVAAVALALPALGAPTVYRRQIINDNGTMPMNTSIADIDIVQFALTLEYLELNLYELGVNMYDAQAFTDAGFPVTARERLEEIIAQEKKHIALLQQTAMMLGGTPTQPCNYTFPDIATVGTFWNTTDAINGLGPSAYLGAGPYISSKMVALVGASIGNIETRHNSFFSQVVGRDPVPTTFLLPLTPTQAYGVASAFIASCPSTNPVLKAVTASPPPLKIINQGYPASPVGPNYTLYFQTGKNYTPPAGTNVAFIYSFNTTIVPLNTNSSMLTAAIPADADGQAYAVLTTATQGQTLSDANSLTTPAAFFVDTPASNYANVMTGEAQYLPSPGGPNPAK